MKVFLIVVAIVVAIMAALSVAIIRFMPLPHNSGFPTTQADWTFFADVLNAIGGTLFAGLAFAGLIWTIRVQQQELKETREEQAKATIALVESQKAHEDHVKVSQQAARVSAAAALLNEADKEEAQLSERIAEIGARTPEFLKLFERRKLLRKRKDELRTELWRLSLEMSTMIHETDSTSKTPLSESSDAVTVKNS